jgi:hypothetical protein
LSTEICQKDSEKIQNGRMQINDHAHERERKIM